MMIKKKIVTFLKQNWQIILIFSVFSFFWINLFLDFSTMWGQDSYWYTRLTENMVSGKGYTLEGKFPHAQYPPGLPILLIPLYLILKNSVLAGLITIFIISLFSIYLSYKIGKEFSKTTALISSLLLSFHNLFLFSSISVLTEIPFMFFSILGLYLFMKSYEKRILIIPSIISITFSILIRYDGFFLIFPIAFYMVYRKEDFNDFFFSKKTFLAIGIGVLILGAWFLRNLIAFGSPLINAHSSGNGSTGLSLSTIYEFFSLFFKTGYLFPFLVLIGIFFVIFKYKNLELKTYLIWILVYMILHSWWWHRALRFYTQILLLLCIFSSISIKEIYSFFPKNKIILGRIFVILLTLLVIFEQLFIFYSGRTNHETTRGILNQYDPIKKVCEYANKNLSDNEVYVFPEYVVYTSFLNKKKMLGYHEGLNYLFNSNGTIYFFTDNLHSWITDPFIPRNNRILLNVPTQQGINIKVDLYTEEVITFRKIVGEREVNATLWKINGFNIIG